MHFSEDKTREAAESFLDLDRQPGHPMLSALLSRDATLPAAGLVGVFDPETGRVNSVHTADGHNVPLTVAVLVTVNPTYGFETVSSIILNSN